MSSEAPRLYTNKPKKAQLKQFQDQHKGKDFSSPSSSSTMETHSSSQPPPQPPKESFARRYKFLWPLLLTVNLGVGAYLFMRTKKKETGIEEEVTTTVSTTAQTIPPTTEKPLPLPTITEPVKLKETGIEEEVTTTVSTRAQTIPPTTEKPLPLPTITEPVKLREPIPEDQQRQLYKWILEEKRKVKPKDPDEKKRIDEEKAILKKFIREKSIPSI